MVVNESRVVPARLLGRKSTGAPSEILLLRPCAGGTDEATLWEALVRPGGKLKPGRVVKHRAGFSTWRSWTPRRGEDGWCGSWWTVLCGRRWSCTATCHCRPIWSGTTSPSTGSATKTVYARVPGSVAAPTAGLHFTSELLDQIDAKGVERVAVSLEVGVGDVPADRGGRSGRPRHAQRAVCRVRSSGAGDQRRARAGGPYLGGGHDRGAHARKVPPAMGWWGRGGVWTDLFVLPALPISGSGRADYEFFICHGRRS